MSYLCVRYIESISTATCPSIGTHAIAEFDLDHFGSTYGVFESTGVIPEVSLVFFVYSLEHKEAHI